MTERLKTAPTGSRLAIVLTTVIAGLVVDTGGLAPNTAPPR